MTNAQWNKMFAVFEQYSQESVDEHEAANWLCTDDCLACKKKQVAIEIERSLGLEYE